MLSQAFFWPFQKNSSPKKLKDSKKTQANFPKTQESANSDDRIPPNIWSNSLEKVLALLLLALLRLNLAI